MQLTVPPSRRRRAIFEKSGMTQEVVGVRMGIAEGAARKSVSRLLNPEVEHDPWLSTLLAFANSLDCSLKDLL